jgi:hypothetical protein
MRRILFFALVIAPLSIFCQSIQKDSTNTLVFERDSAVIVQTTQVVEVALTSQIIQDEINKMLQEKGKIEASLKALNDKINQFYQLIGQIRQAEDKIKKSKK